MFVPIRAVPQGGFVGEGLNSLSEDSLNREKKRLENKFIPLDTLIKAQNSMIYGNRFGDIGQYLRTIQSMPAMQKESYFSDPKNVEFHNAMLNNFKNGMNNPSAQGNIITPQLLKQFGLGNENAQPNKNPLELLKSLFSFSSSNNALGNLAGANVDLTNPNEVNAMKQNIPLTNGPAPIPDAMKPFSQSYSQSAPQSSMQALQPSNDSKRTAMVSQMDQNNKLITNQQKQRADAAASMELWLSNNRDRYVSALKNASKYSDIIGKGEKAWDMLQDKDPTAYEDFKWLEHDFIPLLSNNIRMMEGLSSSNKQRVELNGLAGAIKDWQLRPKRALETFNKQMRTIQDVSDSVFQGAEPAHPGVRRKLLNIPNAPENYISEDKSKPNNDKYSQDAPPPIPDIMTYNPKTGRLE